jgi:hypothetical protein
MDAVGASVLRPYEEPVKRWAIAMTCWGEAFAGELRRRSASAHLRSGPPPAIGIGTRLIPWRFLWPWSESSPSVVRPLGLIPSLHAASRNFLQ